METLGAMEKGTITFIPRVERTINDETPNVDDVLRTADLLKNLVYTHGVFLFFWYVVKGLVIANIKLSNQN